MSELEVPKSSSKHGEVSVGLFLQPIKGSKDGIEVSTWHLVDGKTTA
jgi:hypothetical protein